MVLKGGVSPVGIVPALDVVEDDQTSLGLLAAPTSVEEFAIEAGKEALAR